MGCPSPTIPVHSYTANTFWSISRSKRGFGFLPNAVGPVIVILEHCQVLAKTGVVLVGDPFGEYIPGDLRLWFDRVAAFNEYYVVDFSKSLRISKHMLTTAGRRRRPLAIEVEPPPGGFATQWSELYACFVRRHRLEGIKALSRASFELQMRVPGMVVFRAIKDGSLVGARLWYQQQKVAYSHPRRHNGAWLRAKLFLRNSFCHY
jgi:hypothetical protein